ncbi:hypothetical protein AT959_04010 [Dechloromonas denitrificans]|uniref:Uncharacterized protein n=2 Tax=Dechloromonas denitrificans TaxID=281362 RepID=A0A133XMS7_9RHOO|nr:hypothetical protein AT959_04010 [Dechloromonas denitrificans]
MLTHFVHIKYLPTIDLKSATGILLGVAMSGALTIGSVAILLGIPGALMQLCVHYKVLNPGTEDLKKEQGSKERKNRKGNGRVNFLLHIYASVAIALSLLLGPYYFDATETFFAWPVGSVIVGISVIFLLCVAALVIRHRNGGPVKRLARIRFRKNCGHTHGLWILGFLTLLQVLVCAFLLQIFPFFRQESDLISLINFGLAISLSAAIGIAIRHSWKSAALSLGAGVFLLIFLFDGLVKVSDAVMKTLKLGNLENTTLLVSSAGCQVITGTLGCGRCASSNGEKTPVFRIQGLKILSRVGEEHLLAFQKEQQETRFLLRSPEVISISYSAQSKEELPSTPATLPACVTVEAVSMPPAVTSKEVQ